MDKFCGSYWRRAFKLKSRFPPKLIIQLQLTGHFSSCSSRYASLTLFLVVKAAFTVWNGWTAGSPL